MRRKKGGCLKTIIVFCAFLVVILASVYGVVKYISGDQNGAKVSLFEHVPYQETGESDSDNEDLTEKKSSFYYDSLTDEEKVFYQEIMSGLAEREDEIYIHCDNPEDANRVLKLVLKDHPEFFWCDGGASSTSYDKTFSDESYTVVSPKYNCTEAERQKRQNEVEQAASTILDHILAEASDYEKILYVYEYIIDNTDYEKEAEDNQNLYSVLVRGTSVCAGYSKAMQYLLQKLGVYTIYVTGTTDDGSSHAWNIVQCNGKYYHVDATWGDPVYQQTEEEVPSQIQNISYDYMCCDDESIRKTHYLDEEYTYPVCDSMECNYYVVQGMYYDVYDRSRTLSIMNDMMYEGKNPTVFKFSNSEAYTQARDAILGELYQIVGQNFCTFYGTTEAKIFYLDEEELNKFTLYWEYP